MIGRHAGPRLGYAVAGTPWTVQTRLRRERIFRVRRGRRMATLPYMGIAGIMDGGRCEMPLPLLRSYVGHGSLNC